MNQGQVVGNALQMQNAYAGAAISKIPQVEQEMSRMDSDIGRLEASVEGLAKRLSGVLRAEPPPQNNEIDNVAEVLVPRADAIRHARNRLTQVSNQIDSILSRLET